jgi:hypothetical protein
LKEWLDEHPEARPLGLGYYNEAEPRMVGSEFELPAPDSLAKRDPEFTDQLGLHPGYFAIRVNFLRGDTFAAPDGKGGLHLVPLHEYEYFQQFRPIARAGYSIFIYHITPDEAIAVRRRFGLRPRD